MAKSSGGVRAPLIRPEYKLSKADLNNWENLQSFADFVIADGHNRGRDYLVSNMDEDVIEYLQNLGIEVKSNRILITDDVIREYLVHPKRSKGAAIDSTRYNELEHMVEYPTHIYVDKSQKDLVLVFTGPDSGYSKGKLMKAIVHINYKKGKKVFNKLKSIGIVDNEKMGHPQYELIK